MQNKGTKVHAKNNCCIKIVIEIFVCIISKKLKHRPGTQNKYNE